MAFQHCAFDEKIIVIDPESGATGPRQVMCNTRPINRRCDRCGWNPSVEAKRKARLRESRQEQ